MKIENTLENKSKFFAQYWYQDIFVFVPIMRIFGGDNYREYDYRIDVKHRPILGDCINISVVGLGDDIILFGLKHPLNNMLTLESWNLLHEWKFDLYGLIESGYAVNLNEIEK